MPLRSGPEARTLKLEGDWMQNIAKSFEKKKQSGGWPK